MNRTEYIGKLNSLYVGDKNCLEELITAYDEKDKEIERLNNIIKEVREYIEEHLEREYFDYDILEANTIYNRDLYKVLKILGRENNEKCKRDV